MPVKAYNKFSGIGYPLLTISIWKSLRMWSCHSLIPNPCWRAIITKLALANWPIYGVAIVLDNNIKPMELNTAEGITK